MLSFYRVSISLLLIGQYKIQQINVVNLENKNK